MPLVVIFLIGILAFGLFDLTLGRPLPPVADLNTTHDAQKESLQGAEWPSLQEVSASQVAHCLPDDPACRLVALYHFVLTTIHREPTQPPWIHPQQHPARTLLQHRGDAADLAILLAALLDQQHIRNYVIALPHDSYVLACDIVPSALHQAGGNGQPATLAFDPGQVAAADDPTAIRPEERLDAYAVHVGDAPCPCLLLNPGGPPDQRPGDALPFPSETFRFALDLMGQRHRLVGFDQLTP